ETVFIFYRGIFTPTMQAINDKVIERVYRTSASMIAKKNHLWPLRVKYKFSDYLVATVELSTLIGSPLSSETRKRTTL
ncbi:hypothetical protein L4C54_13280, partial [Vibrio lamellibrachiae]|uniref:hypothetical protein n=1 Tax=Vibrio lamellibrachiae TaxID=2910253 RepID=UPI003D0CE6E5